MKKKQEILSQRAEKKVSGPGRVQARLKREIGSRKRIQRQFQERLLFEKLIADISSHFNSLSSGSFDEGVVAAQKNICETLGFDVSALWQFLPGPPETHVMTHVYVPPDFPVSVPDAMEARDAFPWCLAELMKKRDIILSRLSDAPAEAGRDKASWEHFGIESVLTYPLYVGDGPVFGALGFNTLRGHKMLDQELVSRLKTLADIFANALNRERIERGWREAERRLSLAADSADAGLWSWDFKTNRIWVTKKTRELYGLSADEEATGDIFFQLLHPDDLERFKSVVEQAFRSGSLVLIDYRVVLPDKRIRWMGVRAQAFLKPSGEPDCMTGVSMDITNRKESEDERAQLRHELAHLARVLAMNELSASLAHEINQPLGAILNNASAARTLTSMGKDQPGEISEILKDIVQDARRAGDIVRKIRGMVKKTEVRVESLDVPALIDDVVQLFQNRLKIGNISLRLDLQPDLAKVQGDRIQLQQVLLNLITNAIEAMEKSSERTLTIRSRMQTPDRVTVSVTDSGPGIDAAMKERLFEPFIGTKDQGLGMGLTICRSIIEQHGGRIRLEVDSSAGTTFSFTLKAWT